MKKLLFAGGIIIAGLGAAYAQNKMTVTKAPETVQQKERIAQSERKMDPKMIADQKTQRLEKAVSLTADQKAKVHAIYLEEATKMQGRAVLNKATNEKIKTVLTADQIQELEAASTEHKNSRKQKVETRKDFQKDAPGKKVMAK